MPQTSVTGIRHNVLVKYFEESSQKGFQLFFNLVDGLEEDFAPGGQLSFFNPDRYVT